MQQRILMCDIEKVKGVYLLAGAHWVEGTGR